MPIDQKGIRENIRRLRKTIKKSADELTPNRVHKLRTRCRRLEVTADALSSILKRKDRRLMRRLEKIHKKAGRVRDMDVLTAHLSGIRRQVAEEENFVEVLEYLGTKRYRRASKLHSLLKKNRGSVLQRLKAISDRLTKAKNQNRERADVTAKALQLSSDLAHPAVLDRKNLHPYRLKIKELRDTLKMAAASKAASNPKDEKFVNALGRCKDAIGEWHDWEELLGIAHKLLQNGSHNTLLSELRKIANQKYEQALSITHEMRKLYVRTSVRHKKKAAESNSRTQRQLKAIANVAA